MRQESLRSTESATDGSYRWPAKLQYNPFTEVQRIMNEPLEKYNGVPLHIRTDIRAKYIGSTNRIPQRTFPNHDTAFKKLKSNGNVYATATSGLAKITLLIINFFPGASL